MKKKLLVTAVLSAVLSVPALAAAEPGELTSEMTVKKNAVLTGDWVFAEGVKDVVVTTEIDEAFKNANIRLGEDGKLTVKAPNAGVNLSNAVIGSSTVTGGAGSSLVIESGKNAGLSASTTSSSDHPFVSKIDVGHLAITSQAAGIYLSGAQSLDIKAGDIVVKGNTNPAHDKVVFANDRADLKIHDFDTLIIDGAHAIAVSEGPSAKSMALTSDRAGSRLEVRNNSALKAALHTNGNSLHVKADTVVIENQAGGAAIMVDRRYETASGTTTAKIEAQTLQVTGDVLVKTTKPEAGLKGLTGELKLDFTGADSFLKGDARVAGNQSRLEVNFSDGARFEGNLDLQGEDSALTVNLTKNAVWTLPAEPQKAVGFSLFSAPPQPANGIHVNIDNASLLMQEGAQLASDSLTLTNGNVSLEQGAALDVKDLALNGGSLTLGTDAGVTVAETLTGQSQVNIVLGTETPEANGAGLTIGAGAAVDKDAALNVGFVDTDGKELTADTVDAATAQKYQKSVVKTEGAPGEEPALSATVNVKEGNVNGAITVDKNGQASSARNTLLDSTVNLASGSVLQLNRILMNDVRKRMGDLRAAEGSSGVWARWDGGRLSGDNSLETDFNTIQMGYDVLNPNLPVRVGVAMSYTDGDSDFARGSADLDAWGLAAYGTWVADNGFFADAILRLAKAENDMKVENLGARLDNMALSISGEIGRRFTFADRFYVEPQAEVTYTYINGERFELGDNTYRLDSTTSLLGRLGAAAGLKVLDRADVYLRASVVHECLGDASVTGFTSTGTSNTQTVDGEDTWVEFGVGGNIALAKNAYLWGDVERTEGGNVDEDWRATVGVRYAW